MIAEAAMTGHDVAARLGLLPAQPPNNIHAMSRGAGYTCSGLYTADHVMESLARAGAVAAQYAYTGCA